MTKYANPTRIECKAFLAELQGAGQISVAQRASIDHHAMSPHCPAAITKALRAFA